MAETSTMFLALTPAMNQVVESHQPESGPIDHVTLNLAVESLSYNFVSGEKIVPLARTVPIEDKSPVDQVDHSATYQTKIELIRTDDEPADKSSEPSAENPMDESVLPFTINDKQDIAADKQNTIVDRLEIKVPTLPTQFLTPATVLKHRVQNTKDLIVCPGVYDGFSARIALSVGFDALYMVGPLPL